LTHKSIFAKLDYCQPV